jgi:hypothetical protein
MKAKHSGLVILATACISVLTLWTATATATAVIKIVELTFAVALVGVLLRSNRHAVLAFLVAASVVVVNQMLLAYGYLTFLNAGQTFSASSFGALPASVFIGAVVAAVTTAGFSLRRAWAYVTVILVLIAVTWPTSLSGLSI